MVQRRDAFRATVGTSGTWVRHGSEERRQWFGVGDRTDGRGHHSVLLTRTHDKLLSSLQ